MASRCVSIWMLIILILHCYSHLISCYTVLNTQRNINGRCYDVYLTGLKHYVHDCWRFRSEPLRPMPDRHFELPALSEQGRSFTNPEFPTTAILHHVVAIRYNEAHISCVSYFPRNPIKSRSS